MACTYNNLVIWFLKFGTVYCGFIVTKFGQQPIKPFVKNQTNYNNLTFVSDLTVRVDKRITLGAFKKELEPFVQTTVDNFKVC